MNKVMPADEAKQDSPPLSLKERFERVEVRSKAFDSACMELGHEGAVDLFYSDADSDWPSLIPKYIDLSSCED
jgi:hypothetical protein